MIPQVLYVNGDSFAFGQELVREVSAKDFFNFSYYQRMKSYSGIIARKLKIPILKNNATPGGSNERAYRTTVEDISKLLLKFPPEKIFVNISLTHAARREFHTNIHDRYHNHMYSFNPNNEHSVIWEIFNKYINTDVGIYNYDILQILAIQNFLIHNKVPYLLSSSMGNDNERNLTKKFVNDETLKQIYKKRFYDDISFNTLARDKNVPYGPFLHPLEEGHELWADHLIEVIEKNNFFDNGDLL